MSTDLDPFGRRLGWVSPQAMDDTSSDNRETSPVVFDFEEDREPNVVTSARPEIFGGIEHGPLFDLDFPCRLIESSTPGHFHLYMDGITVAHKDYMELIELMGRIGILGSGYTRHSLERGYTVVRMPRDRKWWTVDPPPDYEPKHMASGTPVLCAHTIPENDRCNLLGCRGWEPF